LGQKLDGRIADPETPRAQRDLIERFLARHVAYGAACGEIRDRLEQQRRLADPRVPAEQNDGSRHEAAAEHAIELAEPALEPLDAGRLERVEPRELDPPRILCALRAHRAALRRRGLDHGVPRAAIRALALPLRLTRAARLADIHRLRFRHARSIADHMSAGSTPQKNWCQAPNISKMVPGTNFREVVSDTVPRKKNWCQAPFSLGAEIRSASQRRR